MTTLIDYLAEFYGTNNLFLYKKINQSSKDWIVYKTTAKLLVCEIVVSFNPLIHREHLPSVFWITPPLYGERRKKGSASK